MAANRFKRFTYTKRDSEDTLSRSFCTITFTDDTQKTYTKVKTLGQGGYGVVSKMQAADGDVVAVKEFFPYYLNSKALTYLLIPKTLRKKFRKSRKMCEHETKFNQRIHGSAACFFSGDQIQGKKINGSWTFTAYPQQYMVMDYVEGEPLKEFAIYSIQKFIKICIAILKSIKNLHDQNIIHGDIKADNILILINAAGEFEAKLIDTSLTRNINEPIKTKHVNKKIKSPEFSRLKVISAKPAQDIYCAGRMLKEYLEVQRDNFLSSFSEISSYSFSEIDKFNSIFDRMMDSVSICRPNVVSLIKEFDILLNKEDEVDNIDRKILSSKAEESDEDSNDENSNNNSPENKNVPVKVVPIKQQESSLLTEISFAAEDPKDKSKPNPLILKSIQAISDSREYLNQVSQGELEKYIVKINLEKETILENKKLGFKVVYNVRGIQFLKLFGRKIEIGCNRNRKLMAAFQLLKIVKSEESVLGAEKDYLNEANQSLKIEKYGIFKSKLELYNAKRKECEEDYKKEINNGRLERLYIGTLLHRPSLIRNGG